METHDVMAYDLCRCYVEDQALSIPAEVRNTIFGLIRNRDYKALADVRARYGGVEYQSAQMVRFLLQVEAFFKKNAAFRDSNVCEQAAVAAFDRGETLCRITNRRLDYFYSKRDRIDQDLGLVIERAERFIEKLLGDIRPFLDDLPRLLRLTSGASATLARANALPPLKLKRSIECSPGSVPYLRAMSRYFGYSTKVEVQTWNRVAFVPKSWKTDRTIACEPTGSLPFQLAFDTYAKERLRRFGGIDLSCQTWNQDHAYRGSIDGSFATIDLSMASDTLAYNTVAWLLPDQWFEYLRAHRSAHYQLGETPLRKYAKFSSMGNGATFALESLVFLALVRACGSKEGLVYGDDITIEPHLAPLLLKALKFFGFIPNAEKSYLTGPFRESCGKHYFQGVEVTPFYIRDVPAWDKSQLCHVVNGCASLSEYGRLWAYLKGLIAQRDLPLAPSSEQSTSGIHIDVQHAYRQRLIRFRHRQNSGYAFAKSYVPKNSVEDFRDSRALFLWQHSAFRADPEPQLRSLPFGKLEATVRTVIVERLERCLSSTNQASVYTTASGGYRRKWVCWLPPATGVPRHLYGWSDYLLTPCGSDDSGREADSG